MMGTVDGEASGVPQCPTCGRLGEPNARFCTVDGTRMERAPPGDGARSHRRAEVRSAHTGKLLLELRATMEPFAWITWLETKCPIPKTAAHRYLNQARMLRKAA